MTRFSASLVTAVIVGLCAPAIAQQQPTPPAGPDFSKVVVKTFGSINGMIVINEKFLSIFKDDTKIVPGHGPISSKADVIAFRDMLVISRDRMAKLIAEGKATSEAEAQALKPFADLDAKWAANEQASKNWVRVVYNSLRQ